MDRIQEAMRMVDTWVSEGAVPGVAVAVWHRGRIVGSRVAGRQREAERVSENTLFALASVSKPFTAAAIVSVLANQHTSLDTPLVSVLSDFSSADDADEDASSELAALRDRVTFRHLLSHTSGLPENVGVKRVRMSKLPSLDTIIDAMTNVPLQSAPGAELRYSNLGPALAARAASMLDGRDFHAILEQDVLGPAGLSGIVLRPAEDLADRLAIVEDAAGSGSPSESYNSSYWRGLGIPWGGYYGTVHDVLEFAASFLPDQSSPLSSELRSEMTHDQTGQVPGGVHSAGIHWQHGAWGLGWEVKGSKQQHWTGTRTSPATWCHWGQSGTLVWLDPERELGMAVFANRAVSTPWPLRPPRWSDLSDAVVQATEA